MIVISGGQTGADRTGLEVARAHGVETGGTVPKGWRTDEGPDPSLADFGCVEHWSPSYRVRTRVNASLSDGTVWFGQRNSPGYYCTEHACEDYGKPLICNPTVEELVTWILFYGIAILNCAGNRKRTNPSVVALVRAVLGPALEQLNGPLPR